MKILYTITKSEPGGAQTHLRQLSHFFNTQGHEVIIMSVPGGWLEDEAKRLGIKFMPNPYFSNAVNILNCWRAIKCVKEAVKKEKPDIVHAHSSGAGFYTRVAVKNKIPTVYTAHGWGFNTGVPIWQKYLAILGEKIGADFSTKIICVADFVRNLALKYKIASPNKFVVIRNGVELSPYLQKDWGEESLENKKVKIIFVGRLAAPKLPHLFLEALSELPEDISNQIEVVIAGGGPKKDSLKNYAREMKLNQVMVTGEISRDRVMSLLDQADIFVLLSRWEGLPLTILEAMSRALPVLVSDVGGIREMVDERNGVLVNNNLEEVKKSLVKLINEPDLCRRLGKFGRTKVENDFSLEKMFIDTQKIYQEVIKL